jgi:hypothetical protein
MIAGAVMSPQLAVRAVGEPAKVFRLGVLQPGPPGPGYRAFVKQLRMLGYEEGRNLRIEYLQLDSAIAL